MRVGAVIPQVELAHDASMLRDWAQAADDLGFADVLAVEHVLGFRDEPAQSIYGPVVPDTPMQEPLVLFGYLAAVTRRVSLSTGVLVLPQRQTVVVAKQAAALDVLCGGRLRLGVGVGYVPQEHAALNADYHSRGVRIVEQIDVLRALWTEQVVDYDGRWHHLEGAGINPMPMQRPIPVWMGGMSDHAMRRAAATCDGWMAILLTPDGAARTAIEQLRSYAIEAGRRAGTVGVNVFMFLRMAKPDTWGDLAEGWRELGVSDLSVDFTGSGFASVQQHIDALQRVADELGVEPSTPTNSLTAG
jgi:probable F420-dependent oxidoreductase